MIDKATIRSVDRGWFRRVLGKEYMKNKSVHHDWEDGGKCYVLIKEIHDELHGARPDRGGIEGL